MNPVADPYSKKPQDEPPPSPQKRAALRRSWVRLIRRVYEVDPLTCTRCGAPMKILAFITEASVIKRVLGHLDRKTSRPRAPPTPEETFVH